ncbi:MAG: autotransporter domain-containing protein [Pseudomonadales bacterium]
MVPRLTQGLAPCLLSCLLLVHALSHADVIPTGTVTTSGGDPADDGPVLPTTGDLIVPDTDTVFVEGNASLLVNNGSLLRSGRLFTNLGGSGTVGASGTGTRLQILDDLIIGNGGGNTGTLNLSNNAAASVGGGTAGGFLGSALSVGGSGGTGTLTVDNATIDMIPNATPGDVRLSIGLLGNGSASIVNGGVITLQDLSGAPDTFGDGITVGQSSAGIQSFASNASLSVSGAGSAVIVDTNTVGFLVAGLAGNGQLSAVGTVDVLDGATLDISGRGGSSGITLGRGANSVGTLNVSGANSTVNVLGAPGAILVAGDFGNSVGDGDGLLTVTDQARVTIAGTTPDEGFLNIGLGTGNGVVRVETGGSIDVAGTVIVSLETQQNNTQTGQLSVDASSSLSATNIYVGNRGQFSGQGTIVADLLTIDAGGQAQLPTLAGVTTTDITGGSFDGGAGDLIFGTIPNHSLQLTAGATADVGGNFDFANPSGGGTVTLNDPGTRMRVGGSATINGTLRLNDAAEFDAGGAVTVANGGILGGDLGTLTAPSVLIGPGGTLAPGNSPGTLNIIGNTTLDGGVFQFELAGSQPGEFDVLNVDGNLALSDGALSVSLLNGFNPAGQSFDILTATGTVTQGSNLQLVSSGQGPDFELSIRDVGGIDIGSINFVSFDISEIAALNGQQRPMALYLDDICPRIEALANPSANELDLDIRCGNLRNGNNSDAQIAAGIDAITPDEIIGTFDSLLRFTTIQHGNLSRRLNGLRNGASRVNMRGLNIETADVKISGEELQRSLEELANERFDRWGFFSDGRILFGDRDASTRVPGFDFDTASITLGTDYRMQRNLYLGVALGYNSINADFDAGGGVDMSSLSLSLIGTYFHDERFYIDALLTYGWNDVDTSRAIAYEEFGGSVSRRAKGNTDGSQFAAGLGTGMDFTKGRWVFGPHAGADYADILVEDFDESGGAGLNLSIPETVSRTLTANAGLHASYTTTPSWGVLVPYARLDYVHEFKHESETAKVRFAADRFGSDPTDPSQPARVVTDGSDANYVVWSVGVHAQFIRGIAGYVHYRGISGLENLDLSEVAVGLRYETRF